MRGDAMQGWLYGLIVVVAVGFVVCAVLATLSMERRSRTLFLPDAVLDLQREVKRLRDDVESLKQAEDERTRAEEAGIRKAQTSHDIVANKSQITS